LFVAKELPEKIPEENEIMNDGSVEIKELVKTHVDDRGRPTSTAVKKINLTLKTVSSWSWSDRPGVARPRPYA
jgi:hypothetical protein